MSTINRRKFFNRLSVSAFGAFLISHLPLKLFGIDNGYKKIRVKLHSNSVKRNK